MPILLGWIRTICQLHDVSAKFSNEDFLGYMQLGVLVANTYGRGGGGGGGGGGRDVGQRANEE